MRASSGLAALMVLAAMVSAASRDDACTQLVTRFIEEEGAERARALMEHGEAQGLVVWPAAGEGVAGKALAALLAAVLRHNGYENVRLRQPKITDRFQTNVRGDILQYARLQARPGPGCTLDAARWPPSAARETNGTADAAQCAFLTVADLSHDWKLHLARFESAECEQCAVLVAPPRLAHMADVLVQRAEYSSLPLRILLREPLSVFAAELNRSLLVYDRPLELYDSYVRFVPEPQNCHSSDTGSHRIDEIHFKIPISKNAINVLTQIYGPHIKRIVEGFAASTADIRKMIAYDLQHQDGIEEYACYWALTNLRQTDRTSEDRVNLRIRLLLCKDDPDHREYENMCRTIFGNASIGDVKTHRPTTTATIIIEYKTINCERADFIGDELFSTKDDTKEQHVVGWMAASVSASAARKTKHLARPLLAYGAPAGLRPNKVVRGVAGSARLLALAYLHLLNECGVRRLAVLTERSELADELTGVIGDSSIMIRQRNVTSEESIENALREFGDADARVYFVNANATVSAEVICAAQRLGMAAGGEYLWLVREWREAGRCGPGALRPIALGVAWRGAAGAEWWLAGGGGGHSAAVRDSLEARWQDRAWPPLAAPILDGLRLLNRTVTDFISRYPDSVYDRYVYGNTQNLNTAISASKFQGIIQEVMYNKSTYEVATALVFVEQWSGARRDLLAVWRSSAGGVRQLQRAPGAAGRPWCVRTDGPRCYTTRSGDAFAPRCHDNVWWICLAVSVLTPVALVYARRARLRRLKLRDLALFEQLQEQRKNNFSKFSSYLVSRNQFELREELGFGAYGRVRVAVLRRPGSPAHAVAAKEPAMERLQDEAELIREAGVLASLNHENIIRFEAVCLDGRAVFFMEYAFFGDLRHYLRARRPLLESASLEGEAEAEPEAEASEAAYVSASALTRLARQAAEALRYLETRRIVHRDIRAANCLVDETRNLKLADFGLARHFAEEEEEYIWQNLRRLPAACMAPESLMSGVFSAASDVWALGVLMLELVTLGEPPYGTLSTADIVAGLRAGDHPPLPATASHDTRHLLQWCWQRCPAKRPSAVQVRDALEGHSTALAPAPLSTNTTNAH